MGRLPRARRATRCLAPAVRRCHGQEGRQDHERTALMALMPGLLGTLPEPPEDMRAQLAAVADPMSGKNAAFFPPGTNVPRVPRGLHRVDRPEGTLVTNRPGKAMHFATTPRLTDTHLAGLLGHPQS